MDKPNRFRTKKLTPEAMADLEAVLDGLLDRLIKEIGPKAGHADAQLQAALGAAVFALVSKAQERATALPGADTVKAIYSVAEPAAWAAGAALWPLSRSGGLLMLNGLARTMGEGFAHGQEIIQLTAKGATK